MTLYFWAWLAVLAGPARGDETFKQVLYQDAQEQLEAPDIETRCRGLRGLAHLATIDNSLHAVELAERYEEGRGVPKSDAKALFWYTYAALNGVAVPRRSRRGTRIRACRTTGAPPRHFAPQA